MRIRPAHAIDLARLMDLTRQAFGDSAWSESLMLDILEAARQRPWLQVVRVLELGEDFPADAAANPDPARDPAASSPPAAAVIAGYLVLQVIGADAEIQSLAVDLRWRRRGLGNTLLEDTLALAAGRGLERIFLEVRSGNLAAQQFYLRRGFEIFGRRSRYYHSPVEDALLMRRPVASPAVR